MEFTAGDTFWAKADGSKPIRFKRTKLNILILGRCEFVHRARHYIVFWPG
jgi:hypothetical protein